MWEADTVHRIDLLVASNRFKTSILVSPQLFSRCLFDLDAVVFNFIFFLLLFSTNPVKTPKPLLSVYPRPDMLCGLLQHEFVLTLLLVGQLDY